MLTDSAWHCMPDTYATQIRINLQIVNSEFYFNVRNLIPIQTENVELGTLMDYSFGQLMWICSHWYSFIITGTGGTAVGTGLPRGYFNNPVPIKLLVSVFSLDIYIIYTYFTSWQVLYLHRIGSVLVICHLTYNWQRRVSCMRQGTFNLFGPPSTTSHFKFKSVQFGSLHLAHTFIIWEVILKRRVEMFGTRGTVGHCYCKLFAMSWIYGDTIRGFLGISSSITIPPRMNPVQL